MKMVVGANSGWLHLLVWIGVLGLIASLHGIIIGYSRQIFALARAGLLPRALAAIHPRWRTPHIAIIAGGAVGIAAIYSDKFVSIAGQPLTASIVTMSALGAIVMYIVSLLSLVRLRRREPRLVRPFRVPLYPLFPLVALAIAVVSLVAIVYYNIAVSALFAALGILGALVTRRRLRSGTGIEPDPMLHSP
jgi:ethanolamine permease